MIIKHNDATRNRPEGERIVDAPSLFIDVQDFIDQVKNEETWRKYDRNSITVFKTNDMCIVVGGLRKGAEMDREANGVMSIQVLDGMLDVTTDELSVTLNTGRIVALHAGHSFKIVAIEDSFYLLTINGPE